MKTQVIQQRVVDNYKNVISMIKREAKEEQITKLYSVLYKSKMTKGCVTELGYISNENKLGGEISVNIVEGDCYIGKKPFYMTTKHAYKKINNMLQGMIRNFGSDSVQQVCIRMLTFTKEQAEILKQAADNCRY